MFKKIGRNDPCTCGSGRKYKKCCLTNRKLPISNNAIQASQKRLKNSVKEQLGPDAVILDTASKRKMSEIILGLAEDFLYEAESDNEIHNLIMATCFAWNLSLYPLKKRTQEMKKFISGFNSIDSESEDSLTAFLEMMVERKQDFYPDLRRVILNHEVIGGLGNFYLNVVMALDPNEIESTTEND